jgi:hypothetical protein
LQEIGASFEGFLPLGAEICDPMAATHSPHARSESTPPTRYPREFAESEDILRWPFVFTTHSFELAGEQDELREGMDRSRFDIDLKCNFS